MIARPELLAKATMCKQFSDAHTSTFAQATAGQYLKAGRMPATLAKVRKAYGERAKVMGEALKRELGDAIEFTQPKGGLFFWARLSGRQDQGRRAVCEEGDRGEGGVCAGRAVLCEQPGSVYPAA
jgi:DNA-binding transcriptional MocR family regulator